MAKEVRPGITRITLDMPTDLYERLCAYTQAGPDPYSKGTLANTCRRFIHEGLEREGFPAKPRRKRRR